MKINELKSYNLIPVYVDSRGENTSDLCFNSKEFSQFVDFHVSGQ